MDDTRIRQVGKEVVKIIVATDGNIPSKYAHSFNVMKMAQGFTSENQVELVSLLTWPAIKNRIKFGSIFRHYGIINKFKVTLLPVFSKKILLQSIGVRRFAKKAAGYIYKQNPDLAFCRSYLIAIECIKLGLNTVLETHSAEYDTNIDLQSVFDYKEESCFRGLVTISNVLKQIYIENGFPEEKICVLEDGVDLERFNIDDSKDNWRKKLSLPLGKHILLYSGGLYKEKGIKSILETHKKLKRNDVITVLIGGEQMQIDEWKRYCENNGITGVIFLGFLPNADLPKFMKAADVLLMPYDTTINFKVMDINSTSPLKLFEYMGSKRPVLSSAIPAIQKIVKHGETAMLAKENSIDSQAELIEEMLGNSDLMCNISDNAYECVKQYEWSKRCSIILDNFL